MDERHPLQPADGDAADRELGRHADPRGTRSRCGGPRPTGTRPSSTTRSASTSPGDPNPHLTFGHRSPLLPGRQPGPGSRSGSSSTSCSTGWTDVALTGPVERVRTNKHAGVWHVPVSFPGRRGPDAPQVGGTVPDGPSEAADGRRLPPRAPAPPAGATDRRRRPVTTTPTDLPIGSPTAAFYGGDPFPAYGGCGTRPPPTTTRPAGVWGISRHADVKDISKDPETFSNAGGIRPDNGAPADDDRLRRPRARPPPPAGQRGLHPQAHPGAGGGDPGHLRRHHRPGLRGGVAPTSCGTSPPRCP